MKCRIAATIVASILIAIPAAYAAKRARPPQWSREVVDTFFPDARDQLEGPRPEYEAAASNKANSPPATGDSKAPGQSFSWSNLIDATTLENEVKRLGQSLDAVVKSPAEFKTEGYKSARRDFSELAVLFAVVGQYDGPVRWQSAAAGMRGQFARAGFECKVGSDTSFRVAVERKQELAMLVSGERPSTPKTAVTFQDWSQIAARPPLMQRMNIATEERLKPWLADVDTFRRNRDNVLFEAQIVAMLAEVIHRKAYENWDDDTFVDYARELRDAADATAAAAAAEDFGRSRAAFTRATNACTNCHAGYRG